MNMRNKIVVQRCALGGCTAEFETTEELARARTGAYCPSHALNMGTRLVIIPANAIRTLPPQFLQASETMQTCEGCGDTVLEADAHNVQLKDLSEPTLCEDCYDQARKDGAVVPWGE